MTSSDESQDNELLERYRQASSAESLAPRDAVRAAILEEGRRVAASFSTPAVDELRRRRPSRWKMTAFATAATLLLATLVIAPKLLEQEQQGADADSHVDAFKQTAVQKAQIDLPSPAGATVPVVPVQGAAEADLRPKLEDIKPVPSAARQRDVPAPAPIHYPEQSVEISAMNQNRNLGDSNRATTQAFAAASAERSSRPSGALLAAAAAGDSAKVALLLDQRAASVDDRDSTGRTPLMLAVEQHRLDMVRLLLERGADPNATDQAGLTPLMLAQQKGLSEIVSALKQSK